VVERFAMKGYKVEEMFRKLDGNGDGVLTLHEIKSGLSRLHVDLEEEEWRLLVDQIDANSDGVISH
jgi:Ca2+-binding EF-hand superfamily protein